MLGELLSAFFTTPIDVVALKFPELSPAIFTLDFGFLGGGKFPIRWYALGYIAGILGAYYYTASLIARPQLFGGEAPFSKIQLEDIITWITVGIIVGGRLGYVFFYMLPNEGLGIFANPLRIINPMDGGMAFHGGFLGVCTALIFMARNKKLNLFQLADIGGMTAPIGIMFVRLANFTNAELFGRHTDGSMGMVFPEKNIPGMVPPSYNWDTSKWEYLGTEMPRHPSQLYEAFLEGLLPLLVTSILVWKFGALKRKGLIAGIFILMYATGRTIVENFREPDAFVDWLPAWLTMGQLLSAGMFILGGWFIWNVLRQKPLHQVD